MDSDHAAGNANGHAGNGPDSDSDTDSDSPAAKRPKPSPFLPITAAEIRSEFSHHSPSVARVNNGSFGSCPSSVLSAQLRWQRLFLSQPDDFYINTLQPSLLSSRSLLASLVNAPSPADLSLVDNATTAAAIVLQTVSWAFLDGSFQPGDAVLVLHYAYGAVKKSIQAYVARAGGHIIEVPLPFPLSSNQEIIREFRKSLALGKSEGRRVRLAVIDHITSMPSVVIPVKELTRICRDEGVDHVFVDAAHAIGNVEVDVQDIGADFYTSNLHKWFFCPPSVALLYCRNESPASADLHHPVVSHEYGNGLAIESGWIGTRDYSAQLVIPSAVDFVNRFEGGIAGIQKRNHERVVEMGEMLAESWGTCLGAPPDMCSSMAMVGLPVSLGIASESDALSLRKHLREGFQIEVPIYYNKPRGDSEDEGGFMTGYARISHQVYNVEDDYYRLRDAINKLVRGGFNCRMLDEVLAGLNSSLM